MKELADIRLNDGESILAAIHDLRIRVEALEGNLIPAQQRAGYVAPDGSGTERYDNWTQRSDGTDYPGSYGVGPKPFVAYEDDLKVGDSVRVLNEDGSVNPDTYNVESVSEGIVYTQSGQYPRNRVVQVNP